MMPGVQIDQGGVQDLDRIAPVMARAFDPQFGEAWTIGQCTGMLSLPNTALFVASVAEAAHGFALARLVVDEVELLLIAVEPTAQGQGIGRALLKETCSWAQACGAKSVFLEVRNGNPANALYRNVGFVQIGARKQYYRGLDGQLHDAITLALDISCAF